MKVFFKKLSENAELPKQTEGNVGFDLYTTSHCTVAAGKTVTLDTGIAIATYECLVSTISDTGSDYKLPSSTFFTIYPKIEGRSGLAVKGVFPVGGIIDPTYRGEIRPIMFNSSDVDYEFKPGDRVAQLVFYTTLTMNEIDVSFTSDKVAATTRGDKGFGSTGR